MSLSPFRPGLPFDDESVCWLPRSSGKHCWSSSKSLFSNAAGKSFFSADALASDGGDDVPFWL